MSEASDLRAELSKPENAANVFLIILDRQNAAQLDGIESTATNVIATVNPALWSLFRVRNPQKLNQDDPQLGALICAGDQTVGAVVLGPGSGLARQKLTCGCDQIDDGVKVTNIFAQGGLL
jgi:hypothetical protein